MAPGQVTAFCKTKSKQSFANHATDFDLTFRFIISGGQVHKTRGSTHFGNSEIRWPPAWRDETFSYLVLRTVWGSDSRQPSKRVERWIEVNQNDGIGADVLLENLEVVP